MIPTVRGRLWLWLLCTLVAAPVAWSAATLLDEWHPVGDVAVIALRADDVFSGDPPLVGMPTTLSRSLGEQAYHPGPLEFWLLAVPVRLSDGSRLSPMLTIAVLNGASAIAIVVLAHRAAGRGGAAAATCGVLVLMASLRGETLVDPWNPHAALLALALCLVALAAWHAGVDWGLPVAAGAGSLAAQAHLATASAVAGAVLGWGVLWALGRGAPGRGASRRRAVATAAVVVALCWTPVAVGEILRSPGNVEVLLTGGPGRETDLLGLAGSLDVAAAALAPPAVWMPTGTRPGTPLRWPGAMPKAAAVGVLGATVVVAWRWWLRGQLLPARVLAVGGGALVAGAAAASRIPASNALATHTFLWSWVVGITIWTVLVGGGLGLLLARVGRRWPTAAAVALVALAAAVVAVTPPRAVGDRRTMSAIEPVARDLEASLPAGTYRVAPGAGGLDAVSVTVGLLYALDDSDLDLRLAPSDGPSVTDRRTIRQDVADGVLVVDVARAATRPPSPHAELVADHRPHRGADRRARVIEREVLDAVEDAGGVCVADGRCWSAGEGEILLRSGSLKAFARLGLLERPSLDAELVDRLERALAGPAYVVRVYRTPPPRRL